MRRHRGFIDSDPSRIARIAALLYLSTVLLGIFSQKLIGDQLIIDSDPAATAANILVHSGLYQLGFAVYMVEMVCNVAMTVLFYVLLKPAGPVVSLMAASFSFVGCVLKTMSRLFFLMPLFVLDGSRSLHGFDSAQVQSLALLMTKVNTQGAAVAMIFFGLYAVLKGVLIINSTFLPRILGIIGILAGFSWLTFLYLPVAYRVLPYTLALGLLGSASQIGWLLIFGVDDLRWKARATDWERHSANEFESDLELRRVERQGRST
ncbi:DUF4386 domain-containing protein [Terriglobus sp. TAA 43]|uniref:DUF4386 domain-containing protein n=1 Tax=Terriglobus sp. TAA 43 TaxID=278961 RepID=UPI0006477B8A|nr:DUF4386 domain-containing protein [Terriglobus sp. TAA 43]